MAEKEKVGTVKTCPSCGAPVESFQTRCSNCGHELNQIQTTQSVQDFFQRLEALSNLEYRANKSQEINEKQESQKPHEKIGCGTVVLWLFFFWILWIPIVFRKAKGPYATALAAFGVIAVFSLLLIYGKLNPTTTQNTASNTEQAMDGSEQMKTEDAGLPFPVLISILSISLVGMLVVFVIMKPKWTPEDKRRQSMIEGFPVPNSKEDLMEFIILATGQIKPVSTISRVFSLQAKHQLEWNEIWASKCKQVYTKARIAMQDDPNSIKTISQLMAEAGLKTVNAIT